MIGFIPAAGSGARVRHLVAVKELTPVPAGALVGSGLATDDEVPVCFHALASLVAAGIERSVVVIAERKAELRDLLGDGDRFGLELEYVVQPQPRGLPNAVRACRAALAGQDVLLALPDTIVEPVDAAARLRAGHDADLTLGVFPTDRPELLGPVLLDGRGGVVRVLDKPRCSPAANTWGMAIWGPRFTELCCDWDRRREPGAEAPLGAVFEAARASGLAVKARLFASGAFVDVGTPEGLARARRVANAPASR